MKVLVTCPPMLGLIDLFKPAFERLQWEVTAPVVNQTLSVEALTEIVPQHDGWIIGDDPANATVVKAGAEGRLKAAVKWGVGTDNVSFEAFEQHGIPVRHTPGMFGSEVADIALGYVIALARHTFQIHAGVTQSEWPKPSGISLQDKICGLIGFGDIGRQLCRRLLACGMQVQVYDPFWDSKSELPAENVSHKSWPDDLENCDFLCFTCALTEANFHMLDNEALAGTKPGVRVINVARGPLIDEAALCNALADGRVSAVALDVFEVEPLPSASPLRAYPQNVFGSHNASNTHDAVVRTSTLAIELLEEGLRSSR